MASLGIGVPLPDRSRDESIHWAELARANVAVPETIEDVGRLAREIGHRRRDFWIVVITARRTQVTPSVSPTAVREIVGPDVPIVHLKSLLATHLQTLLPEKLQVYGGALRVYRPGVYDDPFANPLLYDPTGEYGEEILDWLGRIFTPTRARPPHLSPEQLILVLEHDLEQTKRARKRETKILRRRYAEALLALDRTSRRRPPFTWRRRPAPRIEAEVRTLIEDQWASYLPTGDRKKRPLHGYTLTSRFLADVQHGVGDIPLDEIARVCALVLCRFDVRAAGLATGALRPAPGKPQLTKGEGSKAWWCSLTRDTERAPCLVWWRNPDGTTELVACGRLQETSL
jgi:hypothetical protein